MNTMYFIEIISLFRELRASLVAQMVKNPPAMQETWVQSPGWEDPLEKGKATHSSILAREIKMLNAFIKCLKSTFWLPLGCSFIYYSPSTYEGLRNQLLQG